MTVLGYDPEKKDQNMTTRVGIVLQETGIEPYLKVEEVLKQFSGFYNNPRNIKEVIEYYQIDFKSISNRFQIDFK